MSNGEKIHIAKNICEYMNAMSKDKEYTVYEVSIIRQSVGIEYRSREKEQIKINSNTEDGKTIINKMIAMIANTLLKSEKITHTDVKLFKKCRIYEYENRRNACGWGLPEARKKFGFDPVTGFEIK